MEEEVRDFYLPVNTRIIHGNFIYEKNEEVGIYSNVELITVPFPSLTEKQFEFLGLFFDDHQDYLKYFQPALSFNENTLLSNRKKYGSLEDVKEALESKRKTTISRGVINGFIQKLEKISGIIRYPNPDDRKAKSIEISFLGIGYTTYARHYLEKKLNLGFT